MSVRHLHQVVFCSEREERAYRREISVTDRGAMVTAVESLPPHYHIPLERMRDANERVETYIGQLDYFAGYRGCPFCGNRSVFYCECGVISCMNGEKCRVQFCPGCRLLHNVRIVNYTPMSKSGFVHEGQRIEGRGGSESSNPLTPDGRTPERRPLELPSPARMKESEKLQDYFSRKALEDKRKKDGQ